ncbi:MAG: hypothetical protein B7733_26615 [Myxococcales bacterium FL481]|nr:MAG: hypothetical protein B7733_26615 [Myxococcales bacterium FL481]
MGVRRDSRVLAVVHHDVGSLPLRPQDFFVLSRIDGETTAEDVIAATGLARVEAEAILARLEQIGAVACRGTGPSPARRGPSSPVADRPHASESARLRESAQIRRMRMLRAQMAVGRAVEVVREPEPVEVVAGAEVEPRLAEADDRRIEPGIALPVEIQRHALALLDDLGRIDPFALLGITPIDERKSVQRAYHAASRRFHPDRYYGKPLGSFVPRLTTLFEAMTEAYESLLDDRRRADLVAALRRRRSVPRQLDSGVRRAPSPPAEAAASRGGEDAKLALARAREQYARGQVERDAGRPGAAASLFRLALELDPDNQSYRRCWKSCLEEARRQRASRSFAAAQRHLEIGQAAEAAHFLLDAAEADPTPIHLAEAAAAVAETEPHRARELAMRALDAQARSSDIAPADRGRVHMCSAIAFLGGGQVHTARQQARLAAELIADDPRLCAFLNSSKLS